MSEGAALVCEDNGDPAETHRSEIGLLYLGTDGKMHGVEVKHTLAAGRDKIQNKKRGNLAYFERLGKWLEKSPNRVGELYVATDKNPYDLFSSIVDKPVLAEELLGRQIALNMSGRGISAEKIRHGLQDFRLQNFDHHLTIDELLKY